MRQQREKMKKWTVLGVWIVVLGFGLWRSQSSPLLGAEREESSSEVKAAKPKEKTTKKNEKTSESTQTLSAVSNDQGLSATPKIVQWDQDKAFPTAGTSTDELQQLVTDVAIPKPASGIEWEYVNEAGSPVVPSSEEVGTQLVYLKIIENATSSSIQVPIPVTVMNDTVTIEEGVAYTSRSLDIITTSDLMGESVEEIVGTLKQKLGVKAWDVATGEELSVTISDLDGLNRAAKIGAYQLTYSVTLADKSEKKILRTYSFLTDEIMGVESENLSPSTRFDSAQEQVGWTEVALNSTAGLIVNPVNKSKMGFINRGLVPKYAGVGGNQGILIVDENERNFVDGYGKIGAVPYVNGSLLYPYPNGLDANRVNAVEYQKTHTKEHYLMRLAEDGRKELKEILIDTPNQVAYVYNYTLSRNLNFSVKLSMYNTAATAREFAILEMIGLAYFTLDIPIYPLPNNVGYYLRQTGYGADQRMSVKYKDAKGDYLSEFTMYNVGGRSMIDKYLNRPLNLGNANSFLSDFSKPGMELVDYAANPQTPIMAEKNSASQFGARPRLIQPNQAMNVGLEIFAGSELPFMELVVDPENFDIYQDDPIQNFETAYTLEKVPDTASGDPTEGILNVVYPNEEEDNDTFIAGPSTVSANKDFLAANGKFIIPRSKFPDPEHLNDNQGTVKTYHTAMIGNYKAPEVDYSGLPSNEVDVKVNVYHLGGKPIAQTVKKGSTWTKAATSLIKDPVILPANKTYLKIDYVESTPDTSKVGLQFVKVSVNDTKAGKTTIVDVPVNVITGTPPTTGITLLGDDISIRAGKIAGKSDDEIEQIVLKESRAVAWDNATGLSEGIELSLTPKGLVQPVPDKYQLSLSANRDGKFVQAIMLTVTVLPDLSAEAVSQTVTLGTDESFWDTDTLLGTVKNVEGADDGYVVTLVKAPDTKRIRPNGTKMTVKLASSDKPNQGIEVEVPVTVTWGNSLVLTGNGNLIGLNASLSALTLHEDNNGKPYLQSTYGDLPEGREILAFTDFGAENGEIFYQITHIKAATQAIGKDQALEVDDGPNPVEEVTLQALGSDRAMDIVDQLGTGGKLSISYGDVLKVYSVKGYQALYTKDLGPDRPQTGLPNEKTMFVRVTKTGFKPIYINQLQPKEISINAASTGSEAEYDTNYTDIAGYFDIPTGTPTANYTDITPNGFKTYPKLNLAVSEKGNGSVYVAEPLNKAQNQYLTYAYNVEFVGVGPELQIVSPLAPLSFGTPTIKSHTQEIKRSDPNWSFTVLDNRLQKNPWVIQAKMTDTFKTSDTTPKSLKGAELRLKQGQMNISLNSGYQTIFKEETPVVSNTVTWASEDGFFLKVPPGVIEKDMNYSTNVEFVLTDVPTK